MLVWFLSIATALVAAGWVISRRFDVGIESDLAELRETPLATSESVDLPPLLDAYLARAALRLGLGMRWFRIEQAGEMRMRPGDGWKAFDAIQLYAVSEPSFVWKARFKAFTVVDSIVNGAGRIEARILGVLPVVRSSGADTTRAQLLRYLAEIAWVPRAITNNRFISWRQLSDTKILGVLEHFGVHVDLRFFFDEQGDVIRVEGTRECFLEGKKIQTPWIGFFSDYKSLGGIRIPTRGEVQWMLESGPFAYWRGTVTGLRTN